jgi:hypothetical protein
MSYGDDSYGSGSYGSGLMSIESPVDETMSTLTTIRTLVEARVKDAAGKLSASDYNRAIVSALAEYTRDRPRRLFVELPGAGSFDFPVGDWGSAGSELSASTRWDVGFSSLLDVVFPYVSTSRSLPTLDEDEFGIVQLPAGPVLRFAAHTPAVGQKVLVAYSRRHEVTDNWSTVPVADEEALADLAASYALKSLASYYAQATDSSISADVADHPGRSQTYLSLAREYRELYEVHVGRRSASGGVGKQSGPPAAGVITDLDRGYGQGGSYLFHDRRLT